MEEDKCIQEEYGVNICELLWECLCCQMRMKRKDVCCYLNKHVEEYIRENNEKNVYLKNKEISFKVSGNNRQRHAGDLKLHIGIDVKVEGMNAYYISFTSFNVDTSSKNIHIVPGRIQIMLGDGKPNTGFETPYGMCIDVFYPKMQEDTEHNREQRKLKLTDISSDKKSIKDSLKGGRKTFYTGYRLFGNGGTGDILLDESKYEEFMKTILNFINMVEGLFQREKKSQH